MFGFGKSISKAVSRFSGTAKRIENKDLLEAAVAISVLAMNADGEVKPEEEEMALTLIQSHDCLAAFPAEEIEEMFVKFCKKVKTISGRAQLMDEIRDVKSDATEKRDVFLIGLDVVMADGELGAEERTVMTRIAGALGISNFEQYLNA